MVEQHAEIVAVITMNPGKVQGGGAPVFIVKNNEELQEVSLTLEKITDAAAHEIDTDTMIIVAK